MNTTAKQLFISCIDELIKFMKNEPVNPGLYGSQANYLAVCFGLSNIDVSRPDEIDYSKLPYSPEDYFWHSDENCKIPEKVKQKTDVLEVWKEKAKKLPSSKKPVAPEYEAEHTDQESATFIKFAQESIELLTAEKGKPGIPSPNNNWPFQIENPLEALTPSYAEGKIKEYKERLDPLAFRLKLVDPAWHLKTIFNVYLEPVIVDSEEEKRTYYLEQCNVFGINPDCNKYPSDYYDRSTEIYVQKLKEYIKQVQTLLPEPAINPEDVIPIEYQTPPIQVSFMASCIGAGMSPRKLKGLMDDGFYRHITVKQQNYIFDLRQFPPEVRERIYK